MSIRKNLGAIYWQFHKSKRCSVNGAREVIEHVLPIPLALTPGRRLEFIT